MTHTFLFLITKDKGLLIVSNVGGPKNYNFFQGPVNLSDNNPVNT